MTTTEAPVRVPLSGWCSPAPGMRHTSREHAACARYGSVCGCGEHGGHDERRSGQ